MIACNISKFIILAAYLGYFNYTCNLMESNSKMAIVSKRINQNEPI